MNDKEKELFKECLEYCNTFLEREIHLKTSNISILINSKGKYAITVNLL